jgi:hypothetical protein
VVLDCSTGAKIQYKCRIFGLAHGIQTKERPSSVHTVIGIVHPKNRDAKFHVHRNPSRSSNKTVVQTVQLKLKCKRLNTFP